MSTFGKYKFLTHESKMTYTHRLTPLSDSIAETYGRINFTDGVSNIIKGTGNHNYVCGKCNTLLLANIRKEEIPLNYAPFCKNCNTYNDSNKNAIFPSVPVMLKDIPAQIENVISLGYHALYVDPRIPFYGERTALADKLHELWVEEHYFMPGVLYQYTSFFGLVGMLSSHSIWMTDVAYMNDTSEMKYGIDLINNYMIEKGRSSSDTTKELLKRGLVTTSAFGASAGYLIACFCSNDDLLSQWRAYGGGGNGYNLGFSGMELTEATGIQVRKVIYDKSKQLEYIANTVDSICTLFESFIGQSTISQLNINTVLPAFAAMLSNHLKEYLFTFKHEAFAEENEWRIIREYTAYEDVDKLKFRQYNSVPVPYMELTCTDISNKVPILPIVQITHGPVLHPQLTKKSLSLIMRQNGYAHAEIKGSIAPLRL